MTDYQIGVKRITEVPRCPVCMTQDVRETRKWLLHTNGYWNESIEFSCGAKYEFSPNFMCVGLVSKCRDNKEYRERRDMLPKFKAEIVALAKERGVWPEDIKTLEGKLEYWCNGW